MIRKVRSPNLREITLDVYIGGRPNSIAHAEAHCDRNPATASQAFDWFFLKVISVSNAYSQNKLGVLLMYLLLQEIRINMAEYMYITSPATTALGFYQGLGFYPDPDIVHTFHTIFNPTFAEKIKMRQNYPTWRGNAETVYHNIYPKVVQNFSPY